MATLTLEYNSRNKVANSIIDIIIAMDNVFKVKSHTKTGLREQTIKAIQDVEKGNVFTCDCFDDYIARTSDYA